MRILFHISHILILMTRCSKIIGILSYAFTAYVFAFSFSSLTFADATPSATPTPASMSAIITATVPEQQFNPPILITPNNGSVTNNPQEPFSWRRPSPLPATPLDHYDFYLDDVLFAQGLKDNLINSEFYFYTVYRDGDVFHLNMKSNMSEGYHRWKVIAYNEAGLSSESETWTFYIDSINPHIKLISVDTNKLNWNTSDISTIPPVDQRYLYTTPNPLLTGTVEPYANLQFTLLCPPDVINCSSVTETYNYPDGNWQHRFYNLIPNKTYSIYISSSDSAGNHIFFPVFYLIYLTGPISVTPTITPTQPAPTITVTPPATPTITLPSPTTIVKPPTLSEIFLPAEFIPVPPVIPTPPPQVHETIKPPPFNFVPLLIVLIIFGLPLHLAMTQFGTGTNIAFTPWFLFSLIYPFIGSKKFRTYPFTTILLYNSKSTYQPWQIIISDIFGRFYFKKNPPEEFYIISTSFNRSFKSIVMDSTTFQHLCIYLHPQSRENLLKILQRLSMKIRFIPLMVAIITSSIALFITPSYLILIYLYLSIQTAFSEYLYPRLEK